MVGSARRAKIAVANPAAPAPTTATSTGEKWSAGSDKRYRVPRLTGDAALACAPPADGSTLGDDMRRTVGLGVLALSVLYSAIDLLGWLRPVLLRMRIHEGFCRNAAIVLGSMTFKAIILLSGMVLAFWPEHSKRRPEAARRV